uniref:Uncharacterized protein n=1 Tax=Ananas comosus var. bracteatus TaxID=296719 RepID=A0A6V7Q9D9_ANACO|nr:unnamed protein product [Ananas comosus var. bracteatus]
MLQIVSIASGMSRPISMCLGQPRKPLGLLCKCTLCGCCGQCVRVAGDLWTDCPRSEAFAKIEYRYSVHFSTKFADETRTPLLWCCVEAGDSWRESVSPRTLRGSRQSPGAIFGTFGELCNQFWETDSYGINCGVNYNVTIFYYPTKASVVADVLIMMILNWAIVRGNETVINEDCTPCNLICQKGLKGNKVLTHI